MYYLDCVMAVIQYELDSKFTDYQHYYNLNVDEQNAVCALALLFNSKILLDAQIFFVNPNFVPSNSSNQFYEITEQTVGVHVNQEVLIAERVIKVLKIMACTQDWLNYFYLELIERINNRDKNYYTNNNPNIVINTNNNNQIYKKLCYAFLVIIVWIIFMVLGF